MTRTVDTVLKVGGRGPIYIYIYVCIFMYVYKISIYIIYSANAKTNKGLYVMLFKIVMLAIYTYI